jgi:hypothetical protein
MKKENNPFEDTCRDCKHFQKNLERCHLKGYEFYREEEMRETAKHCWAFEGNGEKSKDPYWWTLGQLMRT